MFSTMDWMGFFFLLIKFLHVITWEGRLIVGGGRGSLLNDLEMFENGLNLESRLNRNKVWHSHYLPSWLVATSFLDLGKDNNFPFWHGSPLCKLALLLLFEISFPSPFPLLCLLHTNSTFRFGWSPLYTFLLQLIFILRSLPTQHAGS